MPNASAGSNTRAIPSGLTDRLFAGADLAHRRDGRIFVDWAFVDFEHLRFDIQAAEPPLHLTEKRDELSRFQLQILHVNGLAHERFSDHYENSTVRSRSNREAVVVKDLLNLHSGELYPPTCELVTVRVIEQNIHLSNWKATAPRPVVGETNRARLEGTVLVGGGSSLLLTPMEAECHEQNQ